MLGGNPVTGATVTILRTAVNDLPESLREVETDANGRIVMRAVPARADVNVAIITVGSAGAATTRNANEPIVGYVFDVKGLMGDISLKGAKFSKIDPAQ